MLTQKYTVTVRKPRVDLKYPQPAQLVCPLTILIAVKNPLPLSFTNQVSHSLSSTYSEDTNSKKAKNPNTTKPLSEFRVNDMPEEIVL